MIVGIEGFNLEKKVVEVDLGVLVGVVGGSEWRELRREERGGRKVVVSYLFGL